MEDYPERTNEYYSLKDQTKDSSDEKREKMLVRKDEQNTSSDSLYL